MKLADYIRRQRHKRGFGIHSPFAFMLLHDLAGHRSCRYYEEDRLRLGLTDAPGRVRRQAALIFRLTARMAPQTATCTADLHASISEAIRLADSRTVISQELPQGEPQGTKRRLIVTTTATAESLANELATTMSRPGQTLVILGGNNSHLQGTRGFALPAYLQAMPGGWVLHNREVLIAISSTRVTTQNIAVALI